MKPQSAKSKGRRLQQVIAASIREHFPILTEDDVRSTSMGAPGEDVQLSSLARSLFPYSIEAKNQERLNIWAAIDQANAHIKPTVPISSSSKGAQMQRDVCVVIKKNHSDMFAVIPWKRFIMMLAHTTPDSTTVTQPPTFALNNQVDNATNLVHCDSRSELNRALQNLRYAMDAVDEASGIR